MLSNLPALTADHKDAAAVLTCLSSPHPVLLSPLGYITPLPCVSPAPSYLTPLTSSKDCLFQEEVADAPHNLPIQKPHGAIPSAGAILDAASNSI